MNIAGELRREDPLKKAWNMKSVLIIDDDPDIRSLLSDSVAAMGFTVFSAADGEHGLKILGDVQMDLIILDWMLPGRDGPDILREIRQKKGMENVPVIMLTARQAMQDKLDAFDGGADEYITKPFQYQELQARIKALMRIRDLNLSLSRKNEEILQMQEQLVEKERQLLLLEFAGTAAHKLGQPLSAILLNCHLLETLDREDLKFRRSLEAIKSDVKNMTLILEQLKETRAAKRESYHEGTAILDTGDSRKKKPGPQ